jgi:hypothetical protein
VKVSKDSFAPPVVNDEFGLLIVNWGAHCNNEACMTKKMALIETEMKNLTLPYSSDTMPYTFVWRESEPQHFDSADGNFRSALRSCAPFNDTKHKGNNFRNEVAEKYIRTHDLLGTGIHQFRGIARIYDAMKPMWKLHHAGDCTHYCFSPWRFEVSWHQIYQAINS